MADTLFTIGHGARMLEELVAALRDARIDVLLDVRAVPRSRRHPQFSRASLESVLPPRGIRYEWAGEAFGGRRTPRPDSRHVALGTDVRGFADHMETDAFRRALDTLLARTRPERIAIMCAEREPDDCHRALIADAALVHGLRVIHLGVAEGERPARLNPAARAVAGIVVYDAGQAQLPVDG